MHNALLSPNEAANRMPVRHSRPIESEPADETLMERYVDGNAAAFDELFRRYEQRAFAYFARRTRSQDRAQDLYQELFLRLHRARHEYDPQRAFAPWFFQIAHRLLIDDARRAFRSHEVSFDEHTAALSKDGSRDVVADRQQLAQVLSELSEGERTILLAAKGAGLGYAEIAHQLGKSVDAVKKTVSRTLLRLRRSAFTPVPVTFRAH